MYLDIGASALSLTRTSTYEHFKEATNSYTLPLGVMLKDATDAGSFDYTDSVAMGIAPGYHGTMIFERNATGTEVTITGTDATYSDLGYFSDRITSIHKASSEGGGQITLGGTAVVTDIYQLRYLDYNENTGAVIETILKDTYVNGVQSGSRDVYQAYWDGSAVPSVDIYNSITNGTTVKEDGTPIGEGEEVAAGVKLNNAQINSINVQLATSDVVIEFRFTDKVGVTHSIAYNLDIDSESGGPSFETEIEGYSIVLTIENGEVKVQVLDLDPTNVAHTVEGVVDYVITINGVAITNTYPTQGAITIPVPAPAEPEPEPGD